MCWGGGGGEGARAGRPRGEGGSDVGEPQNTVHEKRRPARDDPAGFLMGQAPS